MVWLAGGADSFNMLMPYDGCTASNTAPDKVCTFFSPSSSPYPYLYPYPYPYPYP